MEAGNFAEAWCIWRPLASRGHPEAQYNLAWLYANGNGLRVDMDQAIDWWKRAASAGHRDSQFALALAYTNGGGGLKKDFIRAVEWYIVAARNGHEDAREILRNRLSENDPAVVAKLPDVVKDSWLGKPIHVKVDRANLRAEPNTGSEVLHLLPQGTVLIEISRQNQWVRVVSADLAIPGWVYAPLVD